MRIVVALGGNALLKRGEPMTAGRQRENVKAAAHALAPLVHAHQLVLSHGNGPQVGLLALQAACYQAVDPYPLDLLDAQTEGMIGYLIEQELGNLLPPDLPLATLLTMIEVDPLDPAFGDPTKFVGPGYSESEAAGIARERGWVFRQEGTAWRRVVPSPRPKRIIEIQPIRWLLEHRAVVICAGGGGIPVMSTGSGREVRMGAEAVIDKDYAGALLAKEIGADLFVMATDVAGVYLDWDSPSRRIIRTTTPGELKRYLFPEGSMGPKVQAACQFVEETKKRAAIGALGEIQSIVSGDAGTQVCPEGEKGDA